MNMDFGRGVRVGLYAQGFLRDLVWQMDGRKREGVQLEELGIEDPMKMSAMEQCCASLLYDLWQSVVIEETRFITRQYHEFVN